MGTPLPPNPQGDDAAVCWGPGKTFGDTGTPEIIRVRFFDWIEDLFFEERFRDFLTQEQPVYQTGAPIAFASQNDTWHWSLGFDVASTILWLNYKPRFTFTFQDFNAPLCATTFVNENDTPGSNIVYGGQAEITWSEIFD